MDGGHRPPNGYFMNPAGATSSLRSHNPQTTQSFIASSLRPGFQAGGRGLIASRACSTGVLITCIEQRFMAGTEARPTGLSLKYG